MSRRRPSIRVGLLLAVIWFSAHGSRAQSPIFVGAAGFNGGPVPVAGVETFLQTGYAAVYDGSVNFAEFLWSQSPCPAAVKIKFFHPMAPGGPFIYLDQRGSFDVTRMRQTVRLDPPVPIHVGDIIAITNVTSCGGPMIALKIDLSPLPPPPPYYAVPGDITSNIVPATPVPTSGPAVYVFARDQSLLLLNGRFRVSLVATNPRSGVTAQGYANQVEDAAGYFSLPEFTQSGIPEVVVKMVDATASPALGADFWFFHAPLTDTQYTLTVVDQTKGTVRTYSNTPGGPGQLCGGADTSAFPGP